MCRCNWYSVNSTSCSSHTQTLIIDMSLLGRSLTLGFFWPIIINFLADLYHFFNIVIRHWLWSLVLSYRSIWCSVSVWIIYENLSFDSTFGTIARCTSSCLWFNHSFIYLGFRNLCCCRCIRWKLLLSRVICCWILFHPTTSFWLLIHFQLLNIWIIVSWVNDSRVLSNKSSTVIQVFKSVYKYQKLLEIKLQNTYFIFQKSCVLLPIWAW